VNSLRLLKEERDIILFSLSLSLSLSLSRERERERERILTDLIYNTIGYKDNYYSPSLCRSFKGFGNCISVKISQIQQ